MTVQRQIFSYNSIINITLTAITCKSLQKHFHAKHFFIGVVNYFYYLNECFFDAVYVVGHRVTRLQKNIKQSMCRGATINLITKPNFVKIESDYILCNAAINDYSKVHFDKKSVQNWSLVFFTCKFILSGFYVSMCIIQNYQLSIKLISYLHNTIIANLLKLCQEHGVFKKQVFQQP